MQNPITTLEDLSRMCDLKCMLVMDASEFEKFFGKTYAAVRIFVAGQHSTQDTCQFVTLASGLLETAVNHHQNESASATQNAVKVYTATVHLLKNIMNTNLNINDSVYENAETTRLSLNAMKACGVIPFWHIAKPYSSRFEDAHENESRNTEALHYAQNNIHEFTRFVFNLASNQEHVADPFSGYPQSTYFSLFKRIKFLGLDSSMIECQSSPTDD